MPRLTASSYAKNCLNPSANLMRSAAADYVASGLSLIPILTDGSKLPAFDLLPKSYNDTTGRFKATWKVFRERRPTSDELDRWFQPTGKQAAGFAVVTGEISGGLEVIDIDEPRLVGRWLKLVEQLAPGLWQRLVLVRTPRPGLHAYFRSEACGKSQPLAFASKTDATGKARRQAVIELKGEGGICTAPPTPRGVHKAGPYLLGGGKDLTMISTISVDERNALLEAAERLSTWKEEVVQLPWQTRRKKLVRPNGDLRPGDDFKLRATWEEILIPHKWQLVGTEADGVSHWRRPGKFGGNSATTNYGGSDLLYVFSTWADPFEAEKPYDKFAAYALLNHDGDFAEAASALRTLGYGGSGKGRKDTRRRRSHHGGFERYATYTTRSRKK